jgi:hypothetical protein
MKKIIALFVVFVTVSVFIMSCSDDSDLQPPNQSTGTSYPEPGKLQRTDTISTQPKPEIFAFAFQDLPTIPVGAIDSITGEILVSVPDSTDIKDLAPTIGYRVVPVPPVFNSTMLTISPPAVHLNYETPQQYTVSYTPSQPAPGNLPSSRVYMVYVVFPNDFLVRPLDDSTSVAFAALGDEFIIKGNFGGDKPEYAVEFASVNSAKKFTLLPNKKFHNSLTITIPFSRGMLTHLGEYKVNVIRKGNRKTADGVLIITNN